MISLTCKIALHFAKLKLLELLCILNFIIDLILFIAIVA